jgi:hypothetical protein
MGIHIHILVGGLEPGNFMTFHSVGNVIIPTDELIFFRGVQTTNQFLEREMGMAMVVLR